MILHQAAGALLYLVISSYYYLLTHKAKLYFDNENIIIYEKCTKKIIILSKF